jgi:epoxyqueuosine reductase QueG
MDVPDASRSRPDVFSKLYCGYSTSARRTCGWSFDSPPKSSGSIARSSRHTAAKNNNHALSYGSSFRSSRVHRNLIGNCAVGCCGSGCAMGRVARVHDKISLRKANPGSQPLVPELARISQTDELQRLADARHRQPINACERAGLAVSKTE